MIDYQTFTHLLPKSAKTVLLINPTDINWIQHFKENPQTEITILINESANSPNINFSGTKVLSGFLGKEPLDLEYNYFEIILGENVLTQCYSLPQSLTELNKLLVPEGIVILIEPNVQYYKILINLLKGNWDNSLDNEKRNFHFFTPLSLIKLLTSSHFTVLGVGGIELDEGQDFPLENDFVDLGKYRIGPLTEGEYRSFLIKKFMVVAKKNG